MRGMSNINKLKTNRIKNWFLNFSHEKWIIIIKDRKYLG